MAAKVTPGPIEAAARALCRLDGHPENIRFEGAPMWRSYVAQARTVFESLRASAPDGVDPTIWRAMLDACLAADDGAVNP